MAHQASCQDIDAWAALEARAMEPNAYLSPHFVCAAARHLKLRQIPSVFFIERRVVGVRQLAGVAVLGSLNRKLRCPVDGMTSRWTSYAPVSGMLFEQEQAPAVLAALLGHLRRHCAGRGFVELPLVWADGEFAALMHSAGLAVRRTPYLSGHSMRAVLVPSAARGQLGSAQLKRQIRDLDRRARRLGERGNVGWRSHRHEGVSSQVVDDFLALEDMGWKSTAGSSLRSSTRSEAFFREVVAGFAAERRMLFTELTLDDTVIASTCNFISGNACFAFKIGWNPEYHAYSPGWLNELELMRQADVLLGGLAYMDSGATADSYINRLWLDRRPLVTLSVPLTFPGRMVLGGVDALRRLKRRLARRPREQR